MEITTTFETYIIIEDEEFKVEVQTNGDIIENGFSHEFGFTSNAYVDNVYVTSLYDIENEKNIEFKSLNKIQQRKLLILAQDELNELELSSIYYEC